MFKLPRTFELEESNKGRQDKFLPQGITKFKISGTKFEILFIMAFVILMIINFTVLEAPTFNNLKVNLWKFHDHNDNEPRTVK